MAHTIWNHEQGDRVEWHNSDPDNETSVFLGDTTAAARFPLIAEHAGYSRWQGDVHVRQSHSYHCAIELVTDGNCLFEQDGRRYVVDPGMVFIKRKGASVFYTIGPRGFTHKQFVVVGGAMLEALLASLHLDALDVCQVDDPRPVVACLESIFRVMQGKDPGYHFELSRLSFNLLTIISQHARSEGYPAAIQSAIGFMEQNMHRDLSIPEIASFVGVSPPHFYRLFKTRTKETPLQFFTKRKMLHAAQLVRNTVRPICDIAAMHGIEDPSFFTKQFRKVMGVTPAQFRKGKAGQ